MSTINDQDASTVKNMKRLVELINEALQSLKGPIITNVMSTKIRTLDSRFIYHHDFIAYRSIWTKFISRNNRKHDETIILNIKDS